MDKRSKLNVHKAFIRRSERHLNVLHKFSLSCVSTDIWIVSIKIISNNCHVNNIKGKEPNTPSKSAKFKKCRRYVTPTENKTIATLVSS